jgi:hypothetical protein
MVATILVDLSLPERSLDDDAGELRGDLSALGRRYSADSGVTLLCGPKSAADRLRRLADLGFDDDLLVKRNGSYVYGDLTEDDPYSIRSLIEPDTSRPYSATNVSAQALERSIT